MKLLLSGFLLGFFLFIGYAFQTLGLLYTTSSKAAFITGLNVVLVPIISTFILKVKPNRKAIIGVCIATIGLYLLTATGTRSINIGDILVLICALGFALQIVFTEQFTKNFPTLLLTVIQIAVVALLSGICSFLFEDWQAAFQPKILFVPEVVLD